MNPLSPKEAEFARARNHRHDGTARRIREALRESARPLSVYALFLLTGIKPPKLRNAIADMISATGGIVSSRGPKGETRYALYRAPERAAEPVASEEFKRAGRITHGRGSRWGAGLA